MHTITNGLSATQSPIEQSILARIHRLPRVRRTLICVTLVALTGAGLSAGPLFVHPIRTVAPIPSLKQPAHADGALTRACGGTLAPC
jgi:hypothetical protein